jgi:hypothetical protein
MYQYSFRKEEDEFSESAMEKILEPAKRAGIITQYDTGRGRLVWFEGTPGPEIRALREKVQALAPSLQPGWENWKRNVTAHAYGKDG